MKKLLAMLLVLTVCFGVFVGCTGNNGGLDDTPLAAGWDARADYVELSDYKAYLKSDLDALQASMGSLSASLKSAVLSAKDAGTTAIDAASDVKTAKAAYDTAATNMCNAIPAAASDIYSYSGLDYAERTKILGQLESYAVRNGMLGISLFEDSGYQVFNKRVKLGSENYITGYGFGTLSEGSLTEPLATENNDAWKTYYHTVNASDPGTMNMLNDQGSEVDDFYSYTAASFFTTQMNETKDGYDWVGELAATDKVEPVGGLDTNNQATTWRFELRKGLKYTTLSKLESRKKYNNREIQLEDYITAFKLLLNQANGLYRGGELAENTGASAIVGADEYYAMTKNAKKGIPSDSEADFSCVKVKAYEEGGKWYFEYTLGAPTTAFFARYYITSSLYMPVPADFIKEVTVDNYLGFNEDKTETPVDNSLAVGPYVVEQWDNEQQVVYKKNANYVFAESKYQIEGIHINILKAAQTDTEAVIREFEAGNIDAAKVPQTKLDTYKSNPLTRKYEGTSTFKLNVNALDQETWIKLFGENGSYYQTPESDYWEVEPALSNAHFRYGLSYALNRKDLGTLKGSDGSASYFSANYMANPETGLSYNSTVEHQNAVSSLVNESTDECGYDLELARDYFRMALDELEADGLITPGTEKNPTVIHLEVAWMYAQNEEAYHKYIKQYWENAFNDSSVSGGRYQLSVDFWVGSRWSDVYYNKMMVGQFDIGFGSISGNTLDPVSFFSVNSTDASISGSFTLNWALETNTLTDCLVYDGKRWSFDALYQATQESTIVEDGTLITNSWIESVTEKVENDNFVVTIEVKNHSKVNELVLNKVVVYGYCPIDDDGNIVDAANMKDADYFEWNLSFSSDYRDYFKKSTYTYQYDAENDVLTIVVTIPCSETGVFYPYSQGIDVYFYTVIGNTRSAKTESAPCNFQAPEA